MLQCFLHEQQSSLPSRLYADGTQGAAHAAAPT
jgi:hypothetical protein